MKKQIIAHLITFLILISCNKDDTEILNLNAGNLKVRIVNELRQPLAGVTISIESLSALTDTNGESVFQGLPVKEHAVSVFKQLYSKTTQKVNILQGKTTILEITLVREDVFVPLKMTKYEGILGNNDQGIQDSIHVLFNKPISVERIQSNWSSCEAAINFSPTDNNMGVQFSFSCAELGGRYPFSITVKDKEGDSLTENIEVSFYHTKLDLEGYTTDMLLINEDKELLISAFNPSRILRYSIESNSILQIYDMSTIMSPIKLSYNPYNDQVYVLGNTDPSAEDRYTGINRPDVYTLNYHTGKISLAFTAVPDEKDHPNAPANIPYNIGFTKTGLGVILLKSNGSSALRWKLIDSSKKDKIYAYPHFENSTVTEHNYFVNMWTNFNQSKLLLTLEDGSVNYGIFDGTTAEISMLHPGSGTRSYTITPHKKVDKFYVRQLYNQFIMDLKGNLSKISGLDSRHGGKADFSYRNNENNIIYICEEQSFVNEPNSFQVLDYNTATTLKSCDVIDDLQEFSTTVNGKYGVAQKRNSDKSSSIYTFLTDTFYSHID